MRKKLELDNIKLRTFRENLGLSQTELSQNSGISWTTYQKLEKRGDKGVVKLKTINNIAKALNISPEKLLKKN